MLTKIAHIIIKYRLILVILLGLFTAFMAYKAKDVEMNYSFIKAVPDDDDDMKYFRKFKDTFGEDGNVIVVGFEDSTLYTDLGRFNKFSKYVNEVSKLNGVKGITAVPRAVYLRRNDSEKKFYIDTIFSVTPATQAELDSMLNILRGQKLYENRLVNSDSGSHLMAITITKAYNDSKDKDVLVDQLSRLGDQLNVETGAVIHYAGLPFLRSWKARKVSEELRIFLILSLVVTALVLLFFFRSFYAVAVPMVIIAMMVIWSMGTIVLMGYQMSILTGLIPPIIVVIGIPNSVYLINKYHQEYRKHGNKIKALSLIVRKIGIVTFITNLTTAIGFLVVRITEIEVLQEFGLVAGLNIMGVFLATIISIPALFAYLPDPKSRHLKHLDFKFFKKLLSLLDHFVHNRRVIIYSLGVLVLVVSIYGITKVKTVSYMLDDLPEDTPIAKDLRFFEGNFGGVMPFEIVIDSKKSNRVTKPSFIKKMDKLEALLLEDTVFSQPISIVGFTKALTQAYNHNNPRKFSFSNDAIERSRILRYLRNSDDGSFGNNGMIDSTGRYARISLRVKDIGSQELDTLVLKRVLPAIDCVFADHRIRDIDEMDSVMLVDEVPELDSIFNGELFFAQDGTIRAEIKEKAIEIISLDAPEVRPTGTTLIFTKGNKFIIKNLRTSLFIAFALIAFIMAALFGSIRMIIISLVPNLIPLVITGGIMGYFDIALKPSTALIFSIAFGISVDDSIHYLAKYRQELFTNNFNVSKAVSMGIKETGSSMIYTSIILFFGFIIFAFSEFGGTIALGVLTSITLFCAMVTNVTLLPALLLSFDTGKRKVRGKKSSYLLVDQFDYDEEEFETSEEIDDSLLKVKVKGDVYEEIYNKEIEDLKKEHDDDPDPETRKPGDKDDTD